MTDQTKYKLCYFVPPTSLQATKDAIFGTNLAGIFSSLTDVNKTLYTDVVSPTQLFTCSRFGEIDELVTVLGNKRYGKIHPGS